MSRYNTDNPIGSADPRDRDDNSKNLDEAVNSESSSFTDRLGKLRPTLKGAIDPTGLASAAASSAQQAASQADRAETARDAATVNADVYPDVSTGRGAVSDGEQFQVLDGDEIVRYRRDSSSSQTEMARYFGSPALRRSSRSMVQRGRVAEGTDITLLKNPGAYLLTPNGSYQGLPDDDDFDPSHAYTLTVTATGDGADGDSGYRFYLQALESHTVSSGARLRRRFTRRVDEQNPESASFISSWVNETQRLSQPEGWFMEPGFFLNASDGEKLESGTPESSCVTDYIPVSEISSLTVHGRSSSAVALLAFYDSERKFISSISGVENNRAMVRVSKDELPSKAMYFRATGNRDATDYLDAYRIAHVARDLNRAKSRIVDISWLIDQEGYWRTQGGVTGLSTHRRTPPIPVKIGDRFQTTTSVSSTTAIHHPVFDADKNVVGSFDIDSPDFIVTPAMWEEGVRYVAFSYRMDDDFGLRYSDKLTDVLDGKVSESGYWRESIEGGVFSSSQHMRTEPLEIRVGDQFFGTMVASTGSIQNPLFNKDLEIIGWFDEESPSFSVTDAVWASGARYAAFSFREEDGYQLSRIKRRRDVPSARIESLESQLQIEKFKRSGGMFAGLGGIALAGASLAYPGNSWFSKSSEIAGFSGYNRAVSGVGTPKFDADRLWRGQFCTPEEFENIDVLAMQYASQQDLDSSDGLKSTVEDYEEGFDINNPDNQFSEAYSHAQCLDYILKYWQKWCYEQKENPESKWYGTQHGKPFRVIFVTHWHDARPYYGDPIRVVAARWGAGVCEFDRKIGFSKNQPLPGGVQVSTLYAEDNQVIDGVEYGWHPRRGTAGEYIQTRMANIFAQAINEWFKQV